MSSMQSNQELEAKCQQGIKRLCQGANICIKFERDVELEQRCVQRKLPVFQSGEAGRSQIHVSQASFHTGAARDNAHRHPWIAPEDGDNKPIRWQHYMETGTNRSCLSNYDTAKSILKVNSGPAESPPEFRRYLNCHRQSADNEQLSVKPPNIPNQGCGSTIIKPQYVPNSWHLSVQTRIAAPAPFPKRILIENLLGSSSDAAPPAKGSGHHGRDMTLAGGPQSQFTSNSREKKTLPEGAFAAQQFATKGKLLFPQRQSPNQWVLFSIYDLFTQTPLDFFRQYSQIAGATTEVLILSFSIAVVAQCRSACLKEVTWQRPQPNSIFRDHPNAFYALKKSIWEIFCISIIHRPEMAAFMVQVEAVPGVDQAKHSPGAKTLGQGIEGSRVHAAWPAQLVSRSVEQAPDSSRV